MQRILFVDDEQKVLDALRRMLRSCRQEWETVFALGGAEALARLEEAPFDVVVTDMRMPGMDGARLLHEVCARFPGTVRLVLSGQCERDVVLQAVGPTHQFLTKPCDSQSLKSTVARVERLRDRLPSPEYRRTVARTQLLPSSPDGYRELHAELDQPAPDLDRVAAIVADDVGLSLRVLQLVSSSFLGSVRRLPSVSAAVHLVGADVLIELAMMPEAIGVYPRSNPARSQSFTAWLEHSRLVACYAGRIARCEGAASDQVVAAHVAGMLHDTGMCLLSEEVPGHLALAAASAQRQGIPFWQAELDLFDVTHADVGAYLVGLWGLDDAIVDAIAWHHRPGQSGQTDFSPLSAVHVADVLAVEETSQGLAGATALDSAYLAAIGCAQRIDAWRQACRDARPVGVCP